MKTKRAIMIVLFMALMFGAEVFAQNQLQVQDIQSQIVGSPDSGGYVQFSVTATALNPTQYGTEFSIVVNGLDDKGSALTSVTLWGRVGGLEQGTLVGQGSMPLSQYTSIVDWVQAQ
jgi:hypothetical protein